MIPYPISHNANNFIPTDISGLMLWYDPNEVTDTGLDGTADILLNQATVPAAPTDAAYITTVPLIITDGYVVGQDSIGYTGSTSTAHKGFSYSEIEVDTNEVWSMCFWCKSDSTSSDGYVFNSAITGRGSTPGIGVYWSGGTLVAELTDGIGGEYSHQTEVIQDTSWHSYIIIYSGLETPGSFSVYEDGVLLTTIDVNNIPFATTTHSTVTFNIGRDFAGTNFLDAQMGHLMFFNTKLTTQNVADLSMYY